MQYKNIKRNQQEQFSDAQSRARIYKVILIPIISLALKVCGVRVLLGRKRSLLGAVSISDNARQGHRQRHISIGERPLHLPHLLFASTSPWANASCAGHSCSSPAHLHWRTPLALAAAGLRQHISIGERPLRLPQLFFASTSPLASASCTCRSCASPAHLHWREPLALAAAALLAHLHWRAPLAFAAAVQFACPPQAPRRYPVPQVRPSSAGYRLVFVEIRRPLEIKGRCSPLVFECGFRGLVEHEIDIAHALMS